MAAHRSGMMSVNIPDKLTLYKSYMGFLKNGGLFIQTPNQFSLQDEVFVVVTLPEETERHPVSGRVAWLSPPHSSSRPQGIGIQFSDTPENEHLRTRIEVLLAGYTSDKPTYTM